MDQVAEARLQWCALHCSAIWHRKSLCVFQESWQLHSSARRADRVEGLPTSCGLLFGSTCALTPAWVPGRRSGYEPLSVHSNRVQRISPSDSIPSRFTKEKGPQRGPFFKQRRTASFNGSDPCAATHVIQKAGRQFNDFFSLLFYEFQYLVHLYPPRSGTIRPSVPLTGGHRIGRYFGLPRVDASRPKVAGDKQRSRLTPPPYRPRSKLPLYPPPTVGAH